MLKKLVVFTLMISVLLSFNAGVSTVSAASRTYDVDFSSSSEGIIKVLFDNDVEGKYKLLVNNETLGERYVYNLFSSDEYVNFPIQLGDGTYLVKFYRNTSGNKYTSIYSEKETIKINDDLDVFLQSNQEVNWNKDDAAIQLANELVAKAQEEKNNKKPATVHSDVYGTGQTTNNTTKEETLTDEEIIEVLYNYVVENYDYDKNKIDTLNYDYIPDIDEFLEDGKGICYDYSVLLASMLRSQGIPTKLIKGYTIYSDVYHAWNEIYIASEDKWVVVDTTYDANRYSKNLPYSMEKSASRYKVKYEF